MENREPKGDKRRDKRKRKRWKLTAFKLHGTGLNVHWEILQVHRAGQDKSQPEIEKQIGRENRRNGGRQMVHKGLRKRHQT